MNPIELPSPHAMPPAARAAEIAQILTRAMARALRVQTINTPEKTVEKTISLGFSGDQRVDRTPSSKQT